MFIKRWEKFKKGKYHPPLSPFKRPQRCKLKLLNAVKRCLSETPQDSLEEEKKNRERTKFLSYGLSLRREANPVTTFVPLSTLFGFTAGGCHAGVSIAATATTTSPKISSSSPESVSASDDGASFSAETCFAALAAEGESHLASM